MKLRLNRSKHFISFLSAGICLVLAGSIAALAQADWRDSILPTVEAALVQQSKQLSSMNDFWAKEAKMRVDFAIYKLGNARMASNPSVEHTHLRQACNALKDEGDLLAQAQVQDAGDPMILDKLITETFAHRDALGCR